MKIQGHFVALQGKNAEQDGKVQFRRTGQIGLGLAEIINGLGLDELGAGLFFQLQTAQLLIRHAFPPPQGA